MVEKTMVGVNLIPNSVRLTQVRRRHVRCWAVAIALALGMVLALLGIESLHRVEAAELSAQNDGLQSDLEAVRAELGSITAGANHVLLQIERARALKSKRAWSSTLAMIASCMPPGAWLTSIATDPPKPPARDARPEVRQRTEPDPPPQAVVIEAPRRLRITGYAPDTAHPYEFVTKLKDTGVFVQVVLEDAQREPMLDGSYFRFGLICEW